MNFEMNIIWAPILLACGLVMLWKSADIMVTGAVGLAERLGVSSLVIGLTVVAMGTSAPEVAASITAAVKNAGDVAIGNVFGSNIANLALVGGLCAIIRPIAVTKRITRCELPVMVIVAMLLWPLLQNLYLSRGEGIALLAIFAALMFFTVYAARKQATNNNQQSQHPTRYTKKHVLFVIIGLVGLAVGANITVKGAVFIGEQIGLSEAVIGLTIIAIGTSLPELATCMAAAIKGHDDLSIGNLVGSNIFNTLLVTGTASLIRPFAIVKRLAGSDLIIMIAITAAFAIIVITTKRIGKISGTILFTIYAAYIVYLLTIGS